MYRLVVCKPDAAEWFDLEPGASAAGSLALSWNEESVVVEGVGRVSWNQPRAIGKRPSLSSRLKSTP